MRFYRDHNLKVVEEGVEKNIYSPLSMPITPWMFPGFNG